MVEGVQWSLYMGLLKEMYTNYFKVTCKELATVVQIYTKNNGEEIASNNLAESYQNRKNATRLEMVEAVYNVKEAQPDFFSRTKLKFEDVNIRRFT